jgi:N-acyl-D-aspartate/D-glutamate deacylase
VSTGIVFRHATVVDGTGEAPYVADVVVADRRIHAVTDPGAADVGAGTSVVDATGLVLAPGFVDLHTHYDAQLLWDATASPSPLHGVTTVFGGNCGFGIAPAATDDDVRYLSRLLARVEGIPLAAIEAGVSWDWSDFGDWLDRLDDRGIAVNAGFLAGHSAIRRAVMGDRAVGEPAAADDLAAMRALLGDMLAAGGMGLSTSRSATHSDGDGRPVPSRAAGDDELLALAAVVGEHPGTQLEGIVPGCISGFTDDEVALLAAMSAAADRPINWNVLGVGSGDGHLAQLAMADRAAALGGRVVALTLPYAMSIRLSFLTGTVLEALPGWDRVFSLPPDERIVALSDPQVRRQLDEGARSPEAGLIGLLANWERLQFVETFADENRRWEGRRVKDVMEATGADPFDALLDVVVADGLRTGLSPVMPADTDEVWSNRLQVWRDPRAVIGGSDAGAHLDMMCGPGAAAAPARGGGGAAQRLPGASLRPHRPRPHRHRVARRPRAVRPHHRRRPPPADGHGPARWRQPPLRGIRRDRRCVRGRDGHRARRDVHRSDARHRAAQRPGHRDRLRRGSVGGRPNELTGCAPRGSVVAVPSVSETARAGDQPIFPVSRRASSSPPGVGRGTRGRAG